MYPLDPRSRPAIASPGALLRRSTLCLAIALAACRSPAELVAEADREVYEIIRERRDELAAGAPFALESGDAPLRERLLEGEETLAPLDLLRCIEVAAENSREYQARREALYLVALDLTLAEWDFSVQENGTFGAFLDRRGGGADSAGLLSNLGLTRLLGTGMRVAGNVGLDLVRDVGTGDGWDAVSNLSLNITQPLLRGFGSDVVREPLTQAERNVMYEARSYERFRRTFAFDVASRFFRILQQEAVLVNEEENLKGLLLLRERNEAFAEAGLLNDIEVDQARQNELAARTRLIETERELKGLRDAFKLFLGLPIGVPLELDAGEQLQLDSWSALALELDEAQVIETALARRFDHSTAIDRVEDAERFLGVAADGLRAGLDLTAGANATSLDGRPLDVRTRNVDVSLGLTYDAPFDRLPERNVYRTAQIALEAAQRDAIESEDRIRTELRDLLRRLAAARASYEIQRNAVTLAVRRVESAQLNLEAGRASTRDVLEATEDLVGARNAASNALTEYILTGLSLYRDMELLRVEEGRIEIDTAPLLERTESAPQP